MEIHGDIGSMKHVVIQELEGLYDAEIASDEFVPQALVQRLAALTSALNKEVGVYLNRKGKVQKVFVGDHQTISLPEIEGRRDARRLSGVRCLHTHPQSSGMLSVIDLKSLISLKFDAMVAIGVMDAKPSSIYAGILLQKDGEFKDYEIYGPLQQTPEESRALLALIAERDKELLGNTYAVLEGEERAILVGMDASNIGNAQNTALLDELEELAQTAGARVLDKIIQKKQRPDAAYFLGKGKIEALALLRQARNANLIIFDDALSGAQLRNIENIVGAKIIDRTALILDIFAKRARSSEGKLQVELAQLKYRLPRLMGMGHVLSRLGGGIGTRGPGETKLETDRRHIRRKIVYLESEIEKIAKKREVLKKGREAKGFPVVAIVGYTNAGKSTLMNTLCQADVMAEDKLFATLDPTSRGMTLPDGRQILFIDTVGFIRKLPHELIESFKSTLEEVLTADLLLHLVDMTHPDLEQNIQVVQALLASIGAGQKEQLLVYNKWDAATEDWILSFGQEKSVKISAKTGKGLDTLLEVLSSTLKTDTRRVVLKAPYSEGWIYGYVCEHGTVLARAYEADGERIEGEIRIDRLKRIEPFLTEAPQ